VSTFLKRHAWFNLPLSIYSLLQKLSAFDNRAIISHQYFVPANQCIDGCLAGLQKTVNQILFFHVGMIFVIIKINRKIDDRHHTEKEFIQNKFIGIIKVPVGI
jgi:hypothetical protein